MMDLTSIEETPDLDQGDIHLWSFRLNNLEEELQNKQHDLCLEELNRAERLRDPLKKQSFIIARSQLRRIIGQYLGLSPTSIHFDYNKHGKPFLSAQFQSDLHFNLSHSGSFGIIGISKDATIGVDIEIIDRMLDVQKIASRFFNHAELKKLGKLLPHRKQRGFYRSWTRTEALLKMYGTGFSMTDSDQQAGRVCNVKNVYIAPGYVAAIAMTSKISTIYRGVLV